MASSAVALCRSIGRISATTAMRSLSYRHVKHAISAANHINPVVAKPDLAAVIRTAAAASRAIPKYRAIPAWCGRRGAADRRRAWHRPVACRSLGAAAADQKPASSTFAHASARRRNKRARSWLNCAINGQRGEDRHQRDAQPDLPPLHRRVRLWVAAPCHGWGPRLVTSLASPTGPSQQCCSPEPLQLGQGRCSNAPGGAR
jgi:hypothetical protein